MKKKWFYILSIIISSALIVTGVVFLFIVNYGVKVPDPVDIFTKNSKTYIQSTLNENSNGYIFKFVSGEYEYVLETKNNLICADNLIEDEKLTLGETYKISVCYKNDYENGYSNFSKEKKWLASQFLATPNLIVMQDYDIESDAFVDKTLMWDMVENAETYLLYYSLGQEILVYETIYTSVELSDLVGGVHNFYVVAKSGDKKYINSAMSNIVQATCYHEIDPFASASFAKSTKELTITSFEDLDEVEIWTGTNENDASLHLYSYIEGSTTFIKRQIGTMYQFIIKVSSYVQTETYIAVKPRVSGYNVYNGDFTIATIL